jgi:hypothetical protein
LYVVNDLGDFLRLLMDFYKSKAMHFWLFLLYF